MLAFVQSFLGQSDGIRKGGRAGTIDAWDTVKSRFIEGFIVGNGLCAVPKNVRQMARNDTQVVPYKVFAQNANTLINWDLSQYKKWAAALVCSSP